MTERAEYLIVASSADDDYHVAVVVERGDNEHERALAKAFATDHIPYGNKDHFICDIYELMRTVEFVPEPQKRAA